MSCKDTAIFWKSPVNIRNYSMNVEVDNGLAPSGGFEEAEVFGVVVEEALREGGSAAGAGKDGEAGLKVGVAIGVVFPDLVSGEVEFGCLVEAVCQPVASSLAFGGVTAPAPGVHPLPAVAGCVGVDGDQADVAAAQLAAPGIDALDAGAEGDVVFFGNEDGGVVAGESELFCYRCRYVAVEAVFLEAAVGAAFARGVAPVAGVEKDFHCAVFRNFSRAVYCPDLG